jgi:Cu(I)/Ag(I) efflux system membrane fusion protein
LSRKQYSPEQIQLAGIKTAPVTFQPLTKEISTVGNVAYDESRLTEITSRVSGYLEKVYVNKTWISVKEGDPLAEIYSPELYSTARELLSALERKGSGDAAKGPREKLRLLGIGDSEIDEIAQSGKANHRLVIRSPQSGHIIRIEVKHGAHVEPGKTLFEVADLSAIWIEAEVFERDIQFLRVGQAIEATVEAFPNRVFKGKVSLVHPHLDPATRTNGVRFDVENTNHELRPGMFATVRIKTPLSEIEPFATLAAEPPFRFASLREDGSREYFTCPKHSGVMMERPGTCPKCQMELQQRPLNENERLIWWCPMHPKVTSEKSGGQCDDCSGMKLVPKLTMLAKDGEVLAVPERAVVDTGAKKIVYVERDPGTFEGIEVELGPRSGDYYPVVKGLEPGDRVAAAGAFLVDAETRLNPAAAATYIGASGGPQSGGSAAAPATSGTTSSTAKESKQSDNAQDKQASGVTKLSAEEIGSIAKLAPADRDRATAQAICPISDEPLGSMGVPYKVMIQGEPVFLCCKGCEGEVKKDPKKVLSKLAAQKSAGEGKSNVK